MVWWLEDNAYKEASMAVMFMMIVILVEGYLFGPLVDLCMVLMFILYHLVSGNILFGVELIGVWNYHILILHCVWCWVISVVPFYPPFKCQTFFGWISLGELWFYHWNMGFWLHILHPLPILWPIHSRVKLLHRGLVGFTLITQLGWILYYWVEWRWCWFICWRILLNLMLLYLGGAPPIL